MGQTITATQTTEALFIPRYRITFRNMFGTERHYTVDGNVKLHKFGTTPEQVFQAVAQARVLYSLDHLNMGEKVVKVEREWESEKGFDEVIQSFQATPGTKITVWSVSSNHDGHGIRPHFSNIIVGRWEGQGDGTARLIDERGQHMGIYSRDDIFTCW